MVRAKQAVSRTSKRDNCTHAQSSVCAVPSKKEFETCAGHSEKSIASGDTARHRTRSRTTRPKTTGAKDDVIVESHVEERSKAKDIKPAHTATSCRRFECPFCDCSFQRCFSLAAHLNIHDEAKACRCVVCSEQFDGSGLLRQHMQRHIGQKQYACDVCTASFNARQNLLQHALIHNSRAATDQCAVSGKVLRGRHSKRKHTHTGIQLKCVICGLTFDNLLAYRRHSRDAHIEKPRHHCEFCGLRFYDVMRLNRHLFARHLVKKSVGSVSDCGDVMTRPEHAARNASCAHQLTRVTTR